MKMKHTLALVGAILLGLSTIVGAQTAVGFYTRYREQAAASVPTPLLSAWQNTFVDTADHKFKRKDSSGTVTTIEGGGSSVPTQQNVSGSSFTVDPASGLVYKFTSTVNVTSMAITACSSTYARETLTLILVDNNIGATWPTTITNAKLSGGTFSKTGSGRTDILSFYCDTTVPIWHEVSRSMNVF